MLPKSFFGETLNYADTKTEQALDNQLLNLTSVIDKNLKRSGLYLDPFSLRRNCKIPSRRPGTVSSLRDAAEAALQAERLEINLLPYHNSR